MDIIFFVVSGDGSRAGEQVRLQAAKGHESFPEDAVAAVEGGRGDRRRGSCVQVNGTPFEIDSFFCVRYRFEPKGTYIIAHASCENEDDVLQKIDLSLRHSSSIFLFVRPLFLPRPVSFSYPQCKRMCSLEVMGLRRGWGERRLKGEGALYLAKRVRGVGARCCLFDGVRPSALFVVQTNRPFILVVLLLLHKGLLAIIHLAKTDAVCFDLGKAGAVQLLVKMWPEWEDDEMRQLLLWAMNEVARIGGLPATTRFALWGGGGGLGCVLDEIVYGG